MEVIGEKLKASREEKGLSLEEVSDDLKIAVKDLKNIEEGNKKSFDDVFLLKKYIYEYAKYLGLDYDELIEEFNEFMFEYTSKIPVEVIERISKQKEKEEESKGALSPYTIISRRNNKRNIIIVVAVVVILVLLLFFAFSRVSRQSNNSNELALSAFI